MHLPQSSALVEVTYMMDPASANPAHNGPAPTDASDRILVNLRGSDVTLISCDNTKFRVHRNILSIASPFFEAMLAAYSTPTVEIPMAESADVLETLIHFIYPLSPRPELVTISKSWPVLEAAQKLKLQSVENNLRLCLRDKWANEPNPLRAWALAVGFDDEISRLTAMLRFLRVEDDNMPTVVGQALEELRDVSAEEYALLLRWRVDAIEEARAIVTKSRCSCPFGRSEAEARARPLSDFCETSTNPFILWDCSNVLIHAWLKCAARTKFPRCSSSCMSLFDLPESATHLFNELLLVVDRAKGQCSYLRG